MDGWLEMVTIYLIAFSTCQGRKEQFKLKWHNESHYTSIVTLESVSYHHQGIHDLITQQWELVVCFRNQSALKRRRLGASFFAHNHSLCLATVVWNPHASSGTSMVSEACSCFVCTTDTVFTTVRRPNTAADCVISSDASHSPCL